jgi:hypothetical protein
MLAARLAFSSAVLAVAFALSTGGAAPAAFDASATPEALPAPSYRPRVIGRLLDVDGEPFVGDIDLHLGLVPSDLSPTLICNSGRASAGGAFEIAPSHSLALTPGTQLEWFIEPRDALRFGEFTLDAREGRRAAGSLTFAIDDAGIITANLGTVQFAEAPRVAALCIDGPVATTHRVEIRASDYRSSKYGPFDDGFTDPFDVTTGRTIELFSWSTADRWLLFTDPATPRAEALTAVVERGRDLVLTSRELLRVCVAIDLPPPAVDAGSARLVVQPITAAVTPSAIVVDPTRDPAREWIVNFEVPARHGATIHRLLLSSHEFELYLHAGIHRIEYWRREHVSDGPLRAATAPVFVERDIVLR